MIRSKAIMTTIGMLGMIQIATAAPKPIQSNVTPDILVGGLAIESGNHTGPVLNGRSTVYAKNARSYQSGLCTFKINFNVYNDSTVQPNQFVTTMSYNNHPNVINDYTVLNAAGIKTYEWLVQLSPGNNTIQVHADQQNNIQESNELNNRLTKRVRVVGQCSAKGALAPVKPVKVKNILKVKNLPVKTVNIKANTTSQQTAKGCAYDPNSARLPCSRKPKMKLINPFE